MNSHLRTLVTFIVLTSFCTGLASSSVLFKDKLSSSLENSNSDIFHDAVVPPIAGMRTLGPISPTQELGRRIYHLLALEYHRPLGQSTWREIYNQLAHQETYQPGQASVVIRRQIEETIYHDPVLQKTYENHGEAEKIEVVKHVTQRILLQVRLAEPLDSLRLQIVDKLLPSKKIKHLLDPILSDIESLHIPELKRLRDAHGDLFRSGEEWLGWHLLGIYHSWDDYLLAMLGLGYEEATLVVAAMFPSHMRQGIDIEDETVYADLLNLVLRRLRKSFSQLRRSRGEKRNILTEQTRQWTFILANLLHVNPDRQYSVPDLADGNGSLGQFSIPYYLSFVRKALKKGSVRNPEKLIHYALSRYPEVLNPGGPLSLFLQYADKAPNASSYQTGREMLELFSSFYEQRGGPKGDGTDPTFWDFAMGRHPEVQAFMQERHFLIPPRQLEFLTRIRDSLLSGQWFSNKSLGPIRLDKRESKSVWSALLYLKEFFSRTRRLTKEQARIAESKAA